MHVQLCTRYLRMKRTRFIPTATKLHFVQAYVSNTLGRNSYHNDQKHLTPKTNKSIFTSRTEHHFLILKRQPLLAPAISQSLMGTNRVT